MHPLDLLIIVLYFLLMIAVGWWVAKKAAKDSESYFLAGKSLPWWVIGVAHGSSGVGGETQAAPFGFAFHRVEA